jgi:hypothetical protein
MADYFKNKAINAATVNFTYKLDVSVLAMGTYFIKASDNNSSMIKSIIRLGERQLFL